MMMSWTGLVRALPSEPCCSFEMLRRAGSPPLKKELADRSPDMCHAKYYALLEKRRFLAPIGESPQAILDLGCGTGESVVRNWGPCRRPSTMVSILTHLT